METIREIVNIMGPDEWVIMARDGRWWRIMAEDLRDMQRLVKGFNAERGHNFFTLWQVCDLVTD